MADLHVFVNETGADADLVTANFFELDRRSALAQIFAPADPQPIGLYFAYGAGRIRKADGFIAEVAAGQVLLTGEATNYVEIDSDGVVSANTSGFTDSKKPIAKVVTLLGSIDEVIDQRIGFDFGAGNGGSANLAWEGEWETATEYAEGDIVQNGEPASSYRSLANHTSGATTEPGVGASWATRWEIVAGAGGQGEQGEQGLPGGSLNWRNDWANATAYSIDDAVQDGTRKSSYRCHTAHTSGSTTRPGLGANWTSYWALLAQAGETGAAGAAGAPGTPGANGLNGVVWQGAWSDSTTYNENDSVSHDGSSYVCLSSHTNQEPPNALYWDVLAAEGEPGPSGPPGGSMDWLGDWEDEAGYAVNDAVQNGDPKSSYRCHTAHTAGASNEPGVGVDWEDYWTLFAEAGSSDANTLEGQDGAHYLDRANHTGSQAISTVTGLQAALDGKAATSHNHDDRYYTELEIDTMLDEFEPDGGGHEIQADGTPLAQQPTMNFTGPGVSVTNDGPNNATVVNIPAGIGAGFGAEMTVRITSNKSIPNSTVTPVSFDEEIMDVGAGFEWDISDPTKIYATDSFTCFVTATVEFASNSTGARTVYVNKNGSTIDQRTINAVTTDETRLGITRVIRLEPGDYVDINVRQLSGGALNIRDVTNVQLVRLAPQAGVDAAKIQGRDVADTAPSDGQVLAWNAGASEYQPVDQSGGGGVSLTPNQFKTLKFDAAPAVMEFVLNLGSGTDPVVLNGGMNVEQIKAALEASDDFTGFTADVFGKTITSAGPDGVALHTGVFIVAVQGEAPFPSWSAVLNSEVQSFVVENGDNSDYTLNGGEEFRLGITEANLQLNQRAIGGDYSDVVVKGIPVPGAGDDLTEGLGGSASLTGDLSSGTLPASYAFDDNNATSISINETGSLKIDLGSTQNVSAYRFRTISDPVYTPSSWTLLSSTTGSFSGEETLRDTRALESLSLGDWTQFDITVAGDRYWKFQFSEGGSGNAVGLAEVEILAPSVPELQSLNSYFPFNVGDVVNPSATGTNAVATTLFQGGSTSTVVTATDSSIEQLILSGLILPESTAPTGAYTPANPSHWNVPPTTLSESVNMLAAFCNSVWGPV